MENEFPVPMLARIVAYELAEFFVKGLFPGLIAGTDDELWFIPGLDFDWNKYFIEVRQRQIPTTLALQLYGYIEHYNEQTYRLTPKTLALLDRPVIQQFIFISYARSTGSAFALLIAKHLRDAGVGD